MDCHAALAMTKKEEGGVRPLISATPGLTRGPAPMCFTRSPQKGGV